MLKCRLVFILNLIAINYWSQEFYSAGSRSNAMAHSTVSLSDGWSYYSNPGALGNLNENSISISYANRFLLKELQSQSVLYIHPLKKGVISVGCQFNGFEVYRNNKIGCGYSLKLSENLFAGIQLNYNKIKLSSFYGDKSLVTAEAGLYTIITNKWKLGFSVFNLGSSKISSYERKTTKIRIGSVFELSKNVLFVLEAEKSVNFQMRLKAAMEYQLIKDFYFRAGIASQPVEMTFGFGYKFKRFQLDLGNSYNQMVGWSPSFSLNYQFQN